MALIKRTIKNLGQSDVLRSAACAVATAYIRFAAWSSRWVVKRRAVAEPYWDRGEPIILAFWHRQLLFMPLIWRKGVPFHMLISGHRDGDLITKTVAPLGIKAIRGSARNAKKKDKQKGAAAAFRTMVRTLKAGESVGITPDGPRGPRMRAQDGAVALAKLTGCAIVPCAFSAKRAVWAKSWDRFLVPLPFSKNAFVWGEPVHIPRDADAETLARATSELERAINALSEEADTLVGARSIEPADVPAPSASGLLVKS